MFNGAPARDSVAEARGQFKGAKCAPTKASKRGGRKDPKEVSVILRKRGKGKSQVADREWWPVISGQRLGIKTTGQTEEPEVEAGRQI